ncbi:putative E3 ubiquitin-protein ligase RAD18-like isoform X2 [Apostichopus japonicus]|uniref:RING-type E3 ubiquitin transferase n=1 Tax=Stichopus japonicus TaxID=307972 RepID=A0A2G8KK72_STIJA|nr:putative E3 ubiquitin-protein ligase RAD18-like isoform X2 [Apostichopus japonicus]
MEFTDPFDWPATMPELRTIDNLLRCGICCEFLNIAMILPKCSHNYCSQCIRRYMNYKSQCPTCNTPTIEGEIRNNKVVDEIVKNFVQVRPHILKLCKGQGEKSHDTSEMVTPTSRKDGKRLPKSSERASSLTPGTVFAVKEASRFFTSGTPKRKPELSEDVPLNRSNEENISPSDDADVVIIDEEKSTSPTTPPPEGSPSASTSNENSANIPSTRSDKSTCPVCDVPVALKHINLHLDSCLKRSSENQKPPRKEKRKPLPKLVYNIMSDKQLRKKLKEYKLATQGTRKELIRRMQEFTVLYNAQCDSDDPIPVNDVIKYYERMEKIRNKAQPKSTSQAFKLNLEKCQNEDDISKSQQNYLQHHSKQFDNLIKIAKEKMKNSKKLPSMENAGNLQDEPCSDPSNPSNAGVNSISDKSTSDNVAKPELLGTVSESSGPGTEVTEEFSSAGSSKSDESDLSDFEQRKENLGSKQTSIVSVKSLETNVATTSELRECPPLPELPGGDQNETCDLEPDSPSLFDSASFSEEEFVDESKQPETSADSNIQTYSAMNDGANSIETNHMADQTSPVFTGSRKKDMDVPSNAYASCSSPSLAQEHLQPPYLKRDGPLPQNKLRRKRKTALEQLEMDLSNVTEDSGRRASKRNKKM